MPTLVLGTPASQEPLESFIERLGDEAIDIVSADGEVCARVIPQGKFCSQENSATSNWVDPRLMELINNDFDELKRIAAQPRSTTTTQELLHYLNSLPLPE